MDRPLFGREPEQTVIHATLQGQVEGRPGLLFVCGEAGIGKSSIARWTAAEAQQMQIAVHWGICWEAGGAPSYWPWIQLMRSLLAASPDSAPLASLVARSPSLLSLLPEYTEPGTDAPVIQPEHARFQLLDSVREFLQLAAAGQNLLLILEDLHAADADSLQLLEYLTVQSPVLSTSFLATFREADARFAGKAGPLWQSARGGRVLRLRGLDADAVHRLLETDGASTESSTRVAALLERTHGNPLFLTELIQYQSGHVSSDLPDSINQVISRQLAALPARTLPVLEAAATVGRSFTLVDLAALLDMPEQEVDALLEPACELQFIEVSETGRCRFAHILHRDAIYQGMEGAVRRELHRTYAQYLGHLTDNGHPERWQELALHLERAGAEQRRSCVEAWRSAGRHARQVSALSDAVACHRRALHHFTESRRSIPQERCALLLELADACMAQGDVSGGHENCREAFRIARALGDNQRMAEAALTFGGVYVAARIDEELIGLLEEAMAALPESAMAERAQVGARLAAARQPATDWRAPVDQARQSLALARQCQDEAVLFTTLRSAVSALIEYVPAAETCALNREYVELADRFNSPLESFRGYSRLMTDYSILGDLAGLERAVDACATLARQLGAPHYQWRVASAEAMCATFQGDFGRAGEKLAEARALADRCDDPASAIPLPLQALELADRDPDTSDEQRDRAIADVEDILQQFPWANLFARSRLEYFQRRRGLAFRDSRSLSASQVEDMLFSGDDFVIADLGRLAMLRDDRAQCERIYGILQQSDAPCSHFGLMGMVWGAPIALELARLARYLGREEDVAGYLQLAREVATRMRAQPTLDEIADFAATSATVEAQTAVPALSLEREGDMWRLSAGNGDLVMKNSRGLQILAQLLQRPGEEIHVLELVGGASTEQAGSEAMSILDGQARAEYKARLGELQEELEEAEELGDSGRAEAARSEMEFITRELSGAFGLGGRPRQSGSDSERARVNVQRRLKDAVRRIAGQRPELGRYLEGTIDTGTYCRYRPL